MWPPSIATAHVNVRQGNVTPTNDTVQIGQGANVAQVNSDGSVTVRQGYLGAYG